MDFPYPFVIVVSDGKSIRALKGAQLGPHEAAIKKALADLLLEAPSSEAATQSAQAVNADREARAAAARAQGYSGDCCTTCMQFMMKQAGHCLVRDACGTTTGCS